MKNRRKIVYRRAVLIYPLFSLKACPIPFILYARASTRLGSTSVRFRALSVWLGSRCRRRIVHQLTPGADCEGLEVSSRPQWVGNHAGEITHGEGLRCVNGAQSALAPVLLDSFRIYPAMRAVSSSGSTCRLTTGGDTPARTSGAGSQMSARR